MLAAAAIYCNKSSAKSTIKAIIHYVANVYDEHHTLLFIFYMHSLANIPAQLD